MKQLWLQLASLLVACLALSSCMPKKEEEPKGTWIPEGVELTFPEDACPLPQGVLAPDTEIVLPDLCGEKK